MKTRKGRTRRPGRKTARPLRPIHKNIRSRRLALELSQRELAALVGELAARSGDGVDVDETSVSQWERGVCAPRGSLLPTVATALKTTIDALYREAA